MQFDVPLLVRPFTSNKGVTPLNADREFWSDVLLSRPQAVEPDIIYSLVTSSGDRFIESSSNQFIAVT
jgi:hypothetical protein